MAVYSLSSILQYGQESSVRLEHDGTTASRLLMSNRTEQTMRAAIDGADYDCAPGHDAEYALMLPVTISERGQVGGFSYKLTWL